MTSFVPSSSNGYSHVARSVEPAYTEARHSAETVLVCVGMDPLLRAILTEGVSLDKVLRWVEASEEISSEESVVRS